MNNQIHPAQRALIMCVLLTLVLVSIRECHIACVAMGRHEGLVYTILLGSAYFTLVFWKLYLPRREQDSKYVWMLRLLTLTLSLIPQVLATVSILALAILITLEMLIDAWLVILERRKPRRKAKQKDLTSSKTGPPPKIDEV